MNRSDLLGAWGEAAAAEYLRKKHYKIVAANFRCRMGEIDLVAENRRYIVFVEVKLRKSADFAQAREFVTAEKQRRTYKKLSVIPRNLNIPSRRVRGTPEGS